MSKKIKSNHKTWLDLDKKIGVIHPDGFKFGVFRFNNLRRGSRLKKTLESPHKHFDKSKKLWKNKD